MIPKFRALHKPNKIMLDVIAINFSLREITADIETRKIYPELDYWWKETDIPFSEIELMQSTGLFDKNGVEIYEGDIVLNGVEPVKSIAQFVDGEWVVSNPKYYNFNCSYVSLYGYKKSLEVIGNIYENKELLEVENG